MEKISYDEFSKIRIVAGQIKKAEAVLGSQKMLKLHVDIGGEERVVLAGIAKNHPPETLVGKKIAFLENIAPRSLLGVESDGMVLAAEGYRGPVLLTFESEVENGEIVR